jgi:hypothetical protein
MPDSPEDEPDPEVKFALGQIADPQRRRQIEDRMRELRQADREWFDRWMLELLDEGEP